MIVAETTRPRGRRTRDLCYELYTRPPDQVLTNLYASAEAMLPTVDALSSKNVRRIARLWQTANLAHTIDP